MLFSYLPAAVMELLSHTLSQLFWEVSFYVFIGTCKNTPYHTLLIHTVGSSLLYGFYCIKADHISNANMTSFIGRLNYWHLLYSFLITGQLSYSTQPQQKPGVNAFEKGDRINRTTFVGGPGQILTTFDEDVNANVVLLSIFSC